MATVATFLIKGVSSLSQSKPHNTERFDGEGYDDYRMRTWREHLHTDSEGQVLLPPSSIKNCLSEAAKFMNISIPGKGKATFTKHVEAGLMIAKPVLLGVKKSDVEHEHLFLPSDGRRGSGKRIWKTFPLIPHWGGDVEVVVLDDTVLQRSQRTGNPVLQDIAEGAGMYIGLGRFRPRNNGYYGRFRVENFAVNSLAMAA